MALFGKKCERCGERIRNGQTKPVCSDCQAKMDLLVAACAESNRTCPLDGEEMVKSIAYTVVIDRCPKCKGVWLDGGELESLYSQASDDALIEVTRGLWVPMG